MGNPLNKVQPGQKLRLPAAAYNAFVDAARDYRSRQQNQQQEPRPQHHDTGIVLVKNASGTDRQRFDVLGVNGTVISPADNLDQFKNKIAMVGTTPTAADHAGRFLILIEPLQTDGIGMAVASGVTPVQIDVQDEAERFADIADGDATKLKSGASGAAAILWKESGTGTKWAVVRMGAGGGGGGSIGTHQYQVHVMSSDLQDAWDKVRFSPE